MTKLYHIEIFIPTRLLNQAQTATFHKLVWTLHAQLELIQDSYGMIPADQIPHSFVALAWELVELEVTDEKIITKYVFRRPVDATRSLVIVLRPAGRSDGLWTANVITAWTNRNADKHKSLDKSKYEKA